MVLDVFWGLLVLLCPPGWPPAGLETPDPRRGGIYRCFAAIVSDYMTSYNIRRRIVVQLNVLWFGTSNFRVKISKYIWIFSESPQQNITGIDFSH